MISQRMRGQEQVEKAFFGVSLGLFSVMLVKAFCFCGGDERSAGDADRRRRDRKGPVTHLASNYVSFTISVSFYLYFLFLPPENQLRDSVSKD